MVSKKLPRLAKKAILIPRKNEDAKTLAERIVTYIEEKKAEQDRTYDGLDSSERSILTSNLLEVADIYDGQGFRALVQVSHALNRIPFGSYKDGAAEFLSEVREYQRIHGIPPNLDMLRNYASSAFIDYREAVLSTKGKIKTSISGNGNRYGRTPQGI